MQRVVVVVVVAAMVVALAVGAFVIIRDESDVEVRRDLVYKDVGGQQLRLDAYLPRREGPHPAVVLLYGGGWVMGDKAAWEPYARQLAQQGFGAIAINYRLAPAATYPAAIDDTRDAIAWVRQHAAELDVDPARLATLGGSAGGHLAALAATEGSGPLDQGSRVAAAVSWSGPMDLHFAGYPAESQGYISVFLGCTPADCDEDVIDDASPITHVDPSDPPMLVANGDADVLVPPVQAERMRQALTAAGVPVDYVLVEGAGHDERLAPGVIEPTLEFLRARLGVAPRLFIGS